MKKLLFIFLLGNLIGYTVNAADKRCENAIKLNADAPLKSKSELSTRFLNAHNQIRKHYKVSNLIWNQTLANEAQKWAETLKTKHKCQLMHNPQRKYGENIAMNWTSKNLSHSQFDKSPEFAVLAWAKECKDYSHSTHKCPAKKVCGHFTQTVWKNTKEVGCGMVTCDGKENTYGSGRLELWVCNYNPPGNYVGQKAF